MGSSLFTAATFFTGVLMAGHIRHGFHMGLYKTWDASLPPHAATSARLSWDYMNVGILLFGLLNWRWRRTGGPRTTEERAMLLVILAGGVVGASRFAAVGDYRAMLAMGLAPVLSVLGAVL